MTNNEERSSSRPAGIADGIRTGIGVLTAFKDALEETIDEAIARGDLSPERAKTLARDAAGRLQDSLGEVRERLDVVPRKEFDALSLEVEQLRLRIEALEGRGAAPPSLPDGGGVDEIPVD